MDWPARSPVLNITENVWAQLARHVYARRRQFQTAEELKCRIVEEWCDVPQKKIKKLYKSIPKRLIKLLYQKGDITQY